MPTNPIVHSDLYYAHIAHDMRTPLQVLTLNLESLQGDFANDPRISQLVASCADEVATLLELTGMVDPDVRKTAMKLKQNSVAEFVTPLAQRFSSPDIECSVVVTGDFQAYAPPIIAKRLLHNLLGNARKAIKARGDGRGHITIEVRAKNKTSGVLLIGDDGCGIPKEQLAQLFTSGFTTNTDNAGRHGIGMGVIAELSAQLGVQVSVTSTVGVGTNFKLEFPGDSAFATTPNENVLRNWAQRIHHAIKSILPS